MIIKNKPFEDVLKDVDFVLDTMGGDYIDRSLKVLRPGGTIISIPSGASESVRDKAHAKGLNGDTFRVQSDGRNMKEIADLLEKGIVKSYVSKIFTIKQYLQSTCLNDTILYTLSSYLFVLTSEDPLPFKLFFLSTLPYLTFYHLFIHFPPPPFISKRGAPP